MHTDWWFWPVMTFAVVLHFLKRATRTITPEQKVKAATGFIGFLARKIK